MFPSKWGCQSPENEFREEIVGKTLVEKLAVEQTRACSREVLHVLGVRVRFAQRGPAANQRPPEEDLGLRAVRWELLTLR